MKRMGKKIKNRIRQFKIIDYIMIFLVLMSLSIILIFYSRKKTTFYINLSLSVAEIRHDVYPPQYWLAKNVEIDDLSFDGAGNKIAKVIDIVDIDYGGSQRQIEMLLEIYGMYDRRTKQYRVNDSVLSIGKSAVFTINNSLIEGVVTGIEPKKTDLYGESTTKEVVLLVQDIDPWFADSYSEDFVTYDRYGKAEFSILNSVTLPAKKTVVTDQGTIKCAIDPIRKDVFILAKANVSCFRHVCYYQKRMPMKLGADWWIQTNQNFIQNASIVGFDADTFNDLVEKHTCQ